MFFALSACSVYLSVCLSVHDLSACLHACRCVWVSLFDSLFVYVSVYLYACLSNCVFLRLSECPSAWLVDCLVFLPPCMLSLSVCLRLYVCFCLLVCLSVFSYLWHLSVVLPVVGLFGFTTCLSLHLPVSLTASVVWFRFSNILKQCLTGSSMEFYAQQLLLPCSISSGVNCTRRS